MGFRARFILGLAWRVALMLATAFAFFESLRRPGLGAARLLAGALFLWALAELWRYIQRTNRELARFLEAVRLGDLSQSFAVRQQGSGFAEVGEALDSGIRALRAERHRLTDASRFFEAGLDDAPPPLLTVDGEGRAERTSKPAGRPVVRA